MSSVARQLKAYGLKGVHYTWREFSLFWLCSRLGWHHGLFYARDLEPGVPMRRCLCGRYGSCREFEGRDS